MNKNYMARIDRVIDYIEANLENKISLAEVAAVSHFSVYHFHRIFTGAVRETVNDFITRRRLERSVNLLVFNPDISITKIALDSGFSSSANFSKAVKLHFGFSPSEIRDPNKIKDSKIGKIVSKYGKAFHPADLYPARITKKSNFEDTKMNVEVRELNKQRVCALSSSGGYQPEAIFETWDTLIAWAINNGISEEQQARFAFCYSNPTITPIDKCRYDASIVIDKNIKVNAPFKSSEIPEGKYAVLYFKGPQEEAANAQPHLSLYSDWLPNSGFEPDNFPILEHYLNDERIDGYIEMEILVKLKEI